MDRFPDFPNMWRELVSRVGEIERQTLGRARLELEANRAAEWQPLNPINGYSFAGAGYAPPACYRDTFGRVYLRGVVKAPASTPSSGTPILVLPGPSEADPTGYRPPYQHAFSAGTDPPVQLVVQANGVLYPAQAVFACVFDAVSFRTT